MIQRKPIVFVLVFLFAASMVGTVYAQTKAVVIPLNSSKPAVAGWAGGDQNITLTDADQVIRTVTLELPGNGLVIVNASGTFFNFGTTNSIGRCSITQGTSWESSNVFLTADISSTSGVKYAAFGATRAFPLAAGTQTFNLVCDCNAGDTISILRTQLNAVFHSIPDIAIPAPLSPLHGEEPCGAECGN